jgi:hypothetical protein
MKPIVPNTITNLAERPTPPTSSAIVARCAGD